MRLSRIIVVAALTLVSIGVLPAAAQTIEAIQQRGKIVIGMDQTIPPYGFTDTSTRPSGYDADVSNAIAKALGVQVEFVQVAGPGRIPALLTNQVDIVVATLSMSPERANQVWFSIPYGSVDVVAVAHDDKAAIGPADFANMRVGVVRGGTQDTSFTPIADPSTEIVRFDDDATVGQALLSGQVDAIIAASHWASELIKRNDGANLQIKFTVRQSPYSIGVRKGETEVLQWMNEFVAFLKFSGQLDAIHRKWLSSPLPELPVW
ncbi:transporter substrate-binding domain-containing protein [Mesorhizobium yinganensis]|uniref:transporter substrate-binding domain-containing protein n=1 Tax=Mesorhizobium yinganensis TaxID=3157707 RepID=UPI0032B7D376